MRQQEMAQVMALLMDPFEVHNICVQRSAIGSKPPVLPPTRYTMPRPTPVVNTSHHGTQQRILNNHVIL